MEASQFEQQPPQEVKTEVDSSIKDSATWAHLDNSEIFWDRYLIG